MVENLETRQDQSPELDQINQIDANAVEFDMDKYNMDAYQNDLEEIGGPLGNSRGTRILNVLLPGAGTAVDKIQEYRNQDEPAIEHLEEVNKLLDDLTPKCNELEYLKIKGPTVREWQTKKIIQSKDYRLKITQNGGCEIQYCEDYEPLGNTYNYQLTIGQFRDIMKIIDEEVDDCKEKALKRRDERINRPTKK